jgi:hypothetical protein
VVDALSRIVDQALIALKAGMKGVGVFYHKLVK